LELLPLTARYTRNDSLRAFAEIKHGRYYKKKLDANAFKWAWESIFHSGEYCKKYCSRLGLTEQLLGKSLFNGEEKILNLNCYECLQLQFVNKLDRLVKGHEYTQILGMVALLENAHKSFRKRIIICDTKGDAPFKKELKAILNFDFGDWDGGILKFESEPALDYGDRLFHPFFGLIYPIFEFNLAEFLLYDDRRKLKKCQECESFFISTKIDDRIKFCSSCSSKSKMSPGQRREYQKKYRAKKKAERDSQKLEVKIKNLMTKLDVTREEALEIINADSKLSM